MFFKIKYVIINTTGSTKITLLLLSKNPLLLGRSKKNGGKFKKLQMDESGFHTRWIGGGVSGAIHLAEIRSWLGTVMLSVYGHSFRTITFDTGRLWTHYGDNGSGTLKKPLCWWRPRCSGGGGTFRSIRSAGTCSGNGDCGGTVFQIHGRNFAPLQARRWCDCTGPQGFDRGIIESRCSENRQTGTAPP